MYGKFKKNHKVFVKGYGEKSGKFYNNKSAIIVERDPYFKDYLVRFTDNSEDWILPKYLRKPYERKRKERK